MNAPVPNWLPPEPTVAKERGNHTIVIRRKEMAIDPVCKMNVESGKAAAKAEHAGQVYYFCSATCHKTFAAEPGKYTSGAAPADHSCCGGHK